MNTDEVLKALYICNNSKGHRCSKCPILGRFEHKVCKATVDKTAINIIKDLQSENEQLKEKNTFLQSAFDEQVKTVLYQQRTINSLHDKIHQLRSELETVTKQRDMAVEDMKTILNDLKSIKCGDEPETYTSGYRAGHQNGRIELLEYLLKLPDGVRSDNAQEVIK